MNNKTVKQLVYGSLLAAMITVATMLLKIPTSLGYIHLGDGVIFLAAMTLGMPAWMAAGIGSGLADLLAGYGIYAPVTFLIKAAMAVIVCLIMKNREIRINLRLIFAFFYCRALHGRRVFCVRMFCIRRTGSSGRSAV